MKQLILVKYGEIILKGLNRPIFEDALVKNIKAALPKDFRGCVHRAQATIYVEPDDPSIIDEVLRRLSKVFGITYLTRAFVLPKDLEAIKTGAAEVLAPALKNAVSFKVEAKRADKKFPYTSPEISKEVGGYLHDCFPHLTVCLLRPRKRRRRHARRLQFQGHPITLRRYRQSRCRLYDRQTRRPTECRPLFLVPIHR